MARCRAAPPASQPDRAPATLAGVGPDPSLLGRRVEPEPVGDQWLLDPTRAHDVEEIEDPRLDVGGPQGRQDLRAAVRSRSMAATDEPEAAVGQMDTVIVRRWLIALTFAATVDDLTARLSNVFTRSLVSKAYCSQPRRSM